MAKIPYFPFYASDWLGSRKVMLMSDAQRGIYITLMAHQWSDVSCSIPTDKKLLQKMLPGSKWKNIDYVIRECFEVDRTNEERARNARISVEHTRAIGKSDKAMEAFKHTKRFINKQSNDNQTIDRTIIPPEPYPEPEPKEPKTFSPDSIEYRTAGLLWDLIRERKPDHKAPDLKAWAKDVDLMIRVDKRTPEKIEAVIRWCQKDSFWQNNILSTAKLRKQFDALDLKRLSGSNGGGDMAKKTAQQELIEMLKDRNGKVNYLSKEAMKLFYDLNRHLLDLRKDVLEGKDIFAAPAAPLPDVKSLSENDRGGE
jgi:uncharacterized protein YdaU (DUF1376 family)